MKIRAIWTLIPAMALSLGACKKKEEAPAAESPAAVETPAGVTPADPAPAAPGASLSAEERAAKLGFAKHLPQDTEVVMSFYNGTKAADRVKSTKLWKLIEAETGMGGGIGVEEDFEINEEDIIIPENEQDATADADDEPEMAEPSGPAALFGTEFTIALGKSTGDQTANILKLNSRMSYFQMRSLAKAFAAGAKTGDFSTIEDAMEEQYGPELLKELLSDPASGVDLVEKMAMPPLYLAFRTSSSEREGAAQQVASLVENMGMFGEMVEPVDVEKLGQKFAGYKIPGEKVSASLAEEREEIEEFLEPAMVDKLLAAVAKKNLVALTGTLGDYVILFFGSSADELTFAEDVDKSMVASDSLAFCDSYASKELVAMVYGQKGMLDQMVASAGGLSDMTAGLRDGLSGSEGLGDTRDLETLLRMVGERETALRALSGIDQGGTVAFFEEGLKIESFGGVDNGAVDWKAQNQLASLGDADDVVLFANMTSEAAYDEKMGAYLEALVETAYAIAMKVSETPAEDGDIAQFKGMAQMFDTTFRPDVVAMWDAFHTEFSSGLGNESALVVDLGGSVPPIPGIPQPVVDQAKFPRISVVAPVTDRAKLASAWGKMNTSATSILGKISEMTGEEIPMQKPMSSERDGFSTWFFSMPFFNDDFMPSVTVGDKWFAASTSKNQAFDLIGKADAGGSTRNGLWFSLNFKALQDFSQETMKVLDENSEALGISGSDLKNAVKAVTVLDDLDKLTAHVRREDGVLRSSIHFKTR